MKRIVLFVMLLIGVSVYFDQFESDGISSEVPPDWAMIEAWPGTQAPDVEATPDPDRVFTAIVIDDSGSMGSEISDAKQAVVTAIEGMDPLDRVALVALNRGVLLEFMDAGDAATLVVPAIRTLGADGTTPLAEAFATAHALLAGEAARTGAFGRYRILATTDGEADDARALAAEVERLARDTPVQIATIGIGITGNHVLRRPDLAAFVTIDGVAQLARALQSAIAEEQTFTAPASFAPTGG